MSETETYDCGACGGVVDEAHGLKTDAAGVSFGDCPYRRCTKCGHNICPACGSWCDTIIRSPDDGHYSGALDEFDYEFGELCCDGECDLETVAQPTCSQGGE